MKFTVGILIIESAIYQATAATSLRINPDLKPKSDEKFFTKDYQDDKRPPIYTHEKYFQHPYPQVQDGDRYDKDYVKDENDDGGYWKAQMAYDAAKNKLGKERRELEEALANAAKNKAAMEAAWKKYLDALKKEAEAHKSEVDKDGEHDKAHADLEKIKQEIKNEADDVEYEITDLEDCKKKLIAAKAKLKELMGEKSEAESHEAERQAAEDALEVVEKEMKKREDEAEKKEAEEKKEHEDALKSYEEEKAEYEKAVADLEAQAKVLRKYRRQVDPDGGVYQVKGDAAHVGLAFPALLAALACMVSIF